MALAAPLRQSSSFSLEANRTELKSSARAELKTEGRAQSSLPCKVTNKGRVAL